MLEIILGISLFILFCLTWTKYAKPKIESFTSGKTPKDITEKIKVTNNDLSDNLNKIKYRNDYENIIVESEKWANESQLQLLVDGKIGVDTLDASIEHVRRFNDLKTFKTNLNDLINVLDAS
jgi:hypothetical protein